VDPFTPKRLDAIAVGTPYSLEITFETGTIGLDRGCGGPQHGGSYLNAITHTVFTLGTFVYTNASGDIYVNAGLPGGGCGGGGTLQFAWEGGWAGGGGPDLGGELLFATVSDSLACDGSLPLRPSGAGHCGDASGVFFGLEGFIGPPDPRQNLASFQAPFVPQAVPEPATGFLVAVGIGALWARKRHFEPPPAR
jgi:hypothetical protein